MWCVLLKMEEPIIIYSVEWCTPYACQFYHSSSVAMLRLRSQFKNSVRKALRYCSSTPNNSEPRHNARGFIFSWSSLGVLALAGAGVIAYFKMEKERKENMTVTNVTSVGKPALGGPFVLFDQDGKAVTDASFKGNYVLLYFGFTHCPGIYLNVQSCDFIMTYLFFLDICPSELVKVGKVIEELGT
jgi:hypothetical protein